MDGVFLGSEALARGALTEYQLRRHYRRLLPDVYTAKHTPVTLTDSTVAAWLWSRRKAVIAGLAASAMHGAEYVDDDEPIELVWPNHRAPRGVITRNDTLLPGEVQTINGLSVTTPERTAFDLARRDTDGEAVAALDALVRATRITRTDVVALAGRHPGARGVRRLPQVLDLVDAGSQSPRETWLRLLLIDAGFPRPVTQIPVFSPHGKPIYYLDMGWPDRMLAAEYDGEQHRENRGRYRRDIVRSEYIASLGWRRVRVTAGDREADIIRRVQRVWVPEQRIA
ncbi:type IV toxin-antitoxin system AbiEi family antitoxin [[Mycobacterium] wendilense]|uniref:Type IV toxin-antitoxin system AbiEi family antitoxin n=1 Tax=[Mycobacterium] wendilense TaxID=3064284 RepID=A0ABN9NZ44_9MYCO|nr:type IV toxin-antitoxin system AbiEi family antitoxin [Mycolicibacterium sp. MU0050]CAJ1580404.1 type IV toxin-antitoxin system AbiEi family antitoxin [Mycolicibacterium sp. MU0050]